MEIQRLNMDSSWAFRWQGLSAIVDPWLVNSEIDGFKWLNEQWHIKDPVAIEALPAADFLLISQSYADHCHFQTLDRLASDCPILATPKACKKLQKKYPERKIDLIPNFDEAPFEKGGSAFGISIPAKKWTLFILGY
jgi:L-ascorbate metabolism protein UlaG (beta-lactamase superfamily)